MMLNCSRWKLFSLFSQHVFCEVNMLAHLRATFTEYLLVLIPNPKVVGWTCILLPAFISIHLFLRVFWFISTWHAIKSTCGFYSSTEQISRNPLISLLKRPRRLPGESVTWDAVGRYWFQWGVSFQVGNSWGQSIHKELTIFEVGSW